MTPCNYVPHDVSLPCRKEDNLSSDTWACASFGLCPAADAFLKTLWYKSNNLLSKGGMQIAQILLKLVASSYFFYRLKSMAGIDLAHHHHAVEVFWHPVEVLQDLLGGYG